MFIPNFANVECGYTVITEDNRPIIESCYEARKANELAVLIQYIDRKNLQPPKASHLDIILYSREQIIKENEAMGSKVRNNLNLKATRYFFIIYFYFVVYDQAPETNSPWGIISVKGQLCDFELPMQPITMMRNALGKEYGGSGVPLDFQKYQESVAFWTKHVSIK